MLVSACSEAQMNPELPMIRAELGMPLSEFLETSSYSFPPNGSLVAGDMFGLDAQGPFDFELVVGDHQLVFERIGPRNLSNSFDFLYEEMYTLRIYPQREGLPLDEALDRAQQLANWFEAAAFENTTTYPIRQSRTSRGELSPVSSLDEARALLMDTQSLVGDMVLYTGEREGIRATLAIINSNRLRLIMRRSSNMPSADDPFESAWLLNLRVGFEFDQDRHFPTE
jgi:hypothetical protein